MSQADVWEKPFQKREVPVKTTQKGENAYPACLRYSKENSGSENGVRKERDRGGKAPGQ